MLAMGRLISAAAPTAMVVLFLTEDKVLRSIPRAVWFETGESKMSASSVN